MRFNDTGNSCMYKLFNSIFNINHAPYQAHSIILSPYFIYWWILTNKEKFYVAIEMIAF